MIGAAIFASTLLILRCRNRHEEVRSRLRDVPLAVLVTSAAFVLVFLAHFCVITPKTLWQEEHAKAAPAVAVAPIPNPTPFKLDVDVKDAEGRKELEKTRGELAATRQELAESKATIRGLDPKQQPIASLRFTVVIKRGGEKNPGHDLQSGFGIILIAVNKELLIAITGEHFENAQGERRYVVDAPFDAPIMGKPVATLASVTDISMQFQDNMVPVGTSIIGGQIALVVNNQTTVTFDIPAQIVAQCLGDNTLIAVRGIQSQMRKVITPPSPNPDTATSPH